MVQSASNVMVPPPANADNKLVSLQLVTIPAARTCEPQNVAARTTARKVRRIGFIPRMFYRVSLIWTLLRRKPFRKIRFKWSPLRRKPGFPTAIEEPDVLAGRRNGVLDQFRAVKT